MMATVEIQLQILPHPQRIALLLSTMKHNLTGEQGPFPSRQVVWSVRRPVRCHHLAMWSARCAAMGHLEMRSVWCAELGRPALRSMHSHCPAAMWGQVVGGVWRPVMQGLCPHHPPAQWR